jgi:hypothetical protein
VGRLKQFTVRHFEAILISTVLMAAFVGTICLEEKTFIINFYYLPVLVAGYYLGRRTGVLTAVFSILLVVICILLFPQRFFGDKVLWHSLAWLFSWAGFLILASVAVGTARISDDFHPVRKPRCLQRG